MVLNTVGARITMVFAAIMTVGLILLVSFYAKTQQDQIIEQNEQSMIKVTESVSEGLQAVMLGGYADIAKTYAANLQNVPGIIDFRILRTDGLEAFLDNKTIENVNERKDEELFDPRDDETERKILPADHAELRLAVSEEKTSFFYSEDENEQRILTFITPIINKKDCYDCHGSKPPVRGVLKLTTSLAAVDEEISLARVNAYKISVVFIVIIIVITAYMIRHTVVNPIRKITQAMHLVSSGHLEQKVPEFSGQEFKTMAKSFNLMSSELQTTYNGLREEHDKITTLIHSTNEGMVITDHYGRIVLTNPAVEIILGKSSEEIILGGFLHLVGDPEIIRKQINRTGKSHEATEFAYGDLTLHIMASTITNASNEPIGTAALIRDVTKEVQLTRELEHMSTIDGLTNLFNRRYLDNKLSAELVRSNRYKSDLSIFLFDVDHFKKFNDEHGHDQGDRVLISLADTVKKTIREIDIACRYGGEEFLVILPETDQEGARIIAERVREEIEKTAVDGLNVTVSIGVSSSHKGEVTDFLQMIQAADKALYIAKDNGRNNVVCAEE